MFWLVYAKWPPQEAAEMCQYEEGVRGEGGGGKLESICYSFGFVPM